MVGTIDRTRSISCGGTSLWDCEFSKINIALSRRSLVGSGSSRTRLEFTGFRGDLCWPVDRTSEDVRDRDRVRDRQRLHGDCAKCVTLACLRECRGSVVSDTSRCSSTKDGQRPGRIHVEVCALAASWFFGQAPADNASRLSEVPTLVDLQRPLTFMCPSLLGKYDRSEPRTRSQVRGVHGSGVSTCSCLLVVSITMQRTLSHRKESASCVSASTLSVRRGPQRHRRCLGFMCCSLPFQRSVLG